MKLPVVEFYYFPLQLGVYFDAAKKKHIQDTEDIIVKESFFSIILRRENLFLLTREIFATYVPSNNIFLPNQDIQISSKLSLLFSQHQISAKTLND